MEKLLSPTGRAQSPPPRPVAAGFFGGPVGTLVGALVVLALALALRLQDLDSGRMSPDDGDFLHSARVHELTPTRDVARGVREDIEWAGMLVEDFGRVEERASFQHSYLHQLAIRWAWRLGGTIGVGRVTALRLDQALLGALTALLVFVWLRRAVPREPVVAWVGGAFVATQLLHVHVSRTGWGQAACTFCLVLMYALAWRMRDIPERAVGRLRWYTLLCALASVAAYGFHEMATVYVAALALIVVLEFGVGDDGRKRWPWRSRRTWYGLAACAPVGVLTVALLLTSEYAQQTWFSSEFLQYGWLETRRLTLIYFEQIGMAQQLGLAVLVLAPIGFVGAVLRDARYARWLALVAFVPTAVLFLKFNNPSLPRIYLPLGVFLCMFAAEGVAVLAALARTRWTRSAVDALAISAVALGAVTSWSTLLAPASAPLHVAGLHRAGEPIAEPRRPLHPLLDALRAIPRAADEPVGVGWVWGPVYRLMDAAVPAVVLDPSTPSESWPRHVVAPIEAMAGGGRLQRDGGPWAIVALDRMGQFGLFQRGQ